MRDWGAESRTKKNEENGRQRETDKGALQGRSVRVIMGDIFG